MIKIDFNTRIRWMTLSHKIQFTYLVQLTFIIVLMFLTTQCTRIEELIQNETPRESYLNAIQNSPLADTDIWQYWIGVGDSVLRNPVITNPPYQHNIIYFPDQPDAWAWRINVQAGRRLEFKLVPSDTAHLLFMDLFSIEKEEVEHLKSVNDTVFNYEVEEDKTLIVRLQPELLIAGTALFSLRDYPTLGFPVKGGRQSDIGSFWGDPRDGGARRHEGVDIFASRGTPVIAVDDGRISRTGYGGLGGKTIWMRTRGRSLYYAHLDSIAIHSGQSVALGDTIGFVGNTGNARTTPPHLHFGIYRRGAVNPFPYIRNPEMKLPPVGERLDQKSRWGRINSSVANVRSKPSTDQPPLTSLARNHIVGLRGITNGWYDVLLPDDLHGYIHSSLVTIRLTSLNDRRVNSGDSIFYSLTSPGLLLDFDQPLGLENYGPFGRFILTRYKNHWVGVVPSGSD